MDLPAETTHYPAGLHVHVDARPLRRAQRLADDLGARLCTTTGEAEVLLDDLSTLPSLDADALAALAALADRVVMAERIIGRTVDRAAEAVGERLAATGSGIAVHPSAVRERAATVITAREGAAAAEERFRIGEAEAERAQAEAAARPEPEPFVPEPVAVASTVDESPARRWWPFGRRSARAVEDTSESTSLLQQMAAVTDEAFGARRAAAARNDHLLLLRAQRDRAMEEVRVAERAWRALAGDDPVEDVEAVVRRFDPQLEEAREVAKETVGVRAVSSLLDRALGQWAEGWQSFGFDEAAVEPADMGALAARSARAVVLAGRAVERAEDIVKAAPAAPVLTVEAEARATAG